MKVYSGELKFLDVVQSPEFVNGFKFYTGEGVVSVGHSYRLPEGDMASIDPTRATARYVVISIERGGERGLGAPGTSYKVITAVRLNEDGTFNPDNETISFKDYSNFDYVNEVELVGKMLLVPQPLEADAAAAAQA